MVLYAHGAFFAMGAAMQVTIEQLRRFFARLSITRLIVFVNALGAARGDKGGDQAFVAVPIYGLHAKDGFVDRDVGERVFVTVLDEELLLP